MSKGDNDQADEMNARLDDQQRKADADANSKLQALTRQRMDIVSSVGGQQWLNPDQPQETNSGDEGLV